MLTVVGGCDIGRQVLGVWVKSYLINSKKKITAYENHHDGHGGASGSYSGWW